MSEKREGMTREDMKAATETFKSMTALFHSMSTNPSAVDNINGLTEVLTQPVNDFKGALLTPFLEGLYANGSPIINALMPIMEDLSGTMGTMLKPTFEALAYLVNNLAPVIDMLTSYLTESWTATFVNIDPNNPGGWEGAGQGAIAGLMFAGLVLGAGHYFFATNPFGWVSGGILAGVSALVGAIIGGFF